MSCDISKNRAGDACSSADEGAASCLSAERMVVCRGGKYVFAECRGAQGCANQAGRAMCDTSVALPGDGCNKEGLKACDKDGNQVLACKEGKMSALYFCRGEKRCEVAASKVNCDMLTAALGEGCAPSMDGKNACSADGAGILVCKQGVFAEDEKCKPGTACTTEGGGISCNKREHRPAP